MLLSIRKIFFNLKFALLLSVGGMFVLTAQLCHISSYADRLSALKNQHALIEKAVKTDLNDIGMANIVINGALSELTLAVKHSGDEELFDMIISSNDEQASLLRSLTLSSEMFQKAASRWITAAQSDRDSAFENVLTARTAMLADIDHMVDYQIQSITQAVSTAKITGIILFIIILSTFLLYRYRLNQIHHDIEKACAIDIDGSKPTILTEEIDFLMKRLARRSGQTTTNPTLLNPMSGLNNEKGMLTAFNAKKASKSANTLFLCLFEIDNFDILSKTLSAEDIGNIFKKLGEIISMYEQPLDVIAQLDDNRLVFFLSRNSKEVALNECDKIVATVNESGFSSARGTIKITLSAGFMLKAPIKSLEDSIFEARKLIEKAQENGGNRVAQLRDRVDSYNR